MTAPTLALHPLHRATGSATYTPPPPSSSTTSHQQESRPSILASLTGPLDNPRRADENPEAASLEVHLRPASNAQGGPRERHLETLLTRFLAGVVLLEKFPRQVFRVGVQVLRSSGEENGDLGDSEGSKGRIGITATKDVLLLPALMNAVVLAAVDSGVPLKGVGVAAVAGLVGEKEEKEEVVVWPGMREARRCRSLHAMAFRPDGRLVFEESVGSFGREGWEMVQGVLKRECVGGFERKGEDVGMGGGSGDEEVEGWLRVAVEEKIRAAGKWRETG